MNAYARIGFLHVKLVKIDNEYVWERSAEYQWQYVNSATEPVLIPKIEFRKAKSEWYKKSKKVLYPFYEEDLKVATFL